MGALFETARGEKEVHILTLRCIRCPSCRLVLAWNDEPRDIECHAEIDHPKNSVARVLFPCRGAFPATVDGSKFEPMM